MTTRGKTIAYFDNSNIFNSQRQAGWRIDAKKLSKRIESSGEIWQVYFFAAVTDPPRYSQTNFYKMLKSDLHWETLIFPLGKKTVTCRKCGSSWVTSTEKGLDVAIATQMLTHAINKAFETALVISGDKDYLETVKTVKRLGMKVEIVGFRSSMSSELAAESSVPVLYLDDIRSEIELKQNIDSEAEAMSGTV